MRTRRIGLEVLLVGAVLLSGCHEHDRCRRATGPCHDTHAPGEPRGVYSDTGDGRVTLYWSPPNDDDLAGYLVYISRNDAQYHEIASVSAGTRHLVVDGSIIPRSVPFEFVNGSTYFLGVAARDWAGNTSELTETSTTFDTPRPAGRNLRLWDLQGPRGGESGYDFSRSPYGYSIAGQSLYADIYFTRTGGTPVMRTAHPQVVEIQDKGFLDFDDPEGGYLFEDEWVPSSEVVLRLGHVYLVKLYEETRPGNTIEPFHAGKFQVVDLDGDSVVIDWAYQLDPNNRELKPAPDPEVER